MHGLPSLVKLSSAMACKHHINLTDIAAQAGYRGVERVGKRPDFVVLVQRNSPPVAGADAKVDLLHLRGDRRKLPRRAGDFDSGKGADDQNTQQHQRAADAGGGKHSLVHPLGGLLHRNARKNQIVYLSVGAVGGHIRAQIFMILQRLSSNVHINCQKT